MAYVEKFKRSLSLRLVPCVAAVCRPTTLNVQINKFQNKQDHNQLKNSIIDLIYRLNQCRISNMRNEKCISKMPFDLLERVPSLWYQIEGLMTSKDTGHFL